MFGAASRSSVAKTGPSSSNFVRAATGRAAGGAGFMTGTGEYGEGGSAMDGSVIGAPPHVGLEQRLRRTVFKSRAAASRARLLRGSNAIYSQGAVFRKASFLGPA
jgi:hypothetical protein